MWNWIIWFCREGQPGSFAKLSLHCPALRGRLYITNALLGVSFFTLCLQGRIGWNVVEIWHQVLLSIKFYLNHLHYILLLQSSAFEKENEVVKLWIKIHLQWCLIFSHLPLGPGSVKTICKWGIPEKSFENVTQLRWPYLRRTIPSRARNNCILHC